MLAPHARHITASAGRAVPAQSIRRYESHQVRAFTAILIVLLIFGVALYDASERIGNLAGPRLRELELASSP